jgi:Zn-finger nucleic acid-binding protein
MPPKKAIECPRCWAPMEVEEVDIIGLNVTIDRCPRCRGIWLDDGELRRLLGDRRLADYLTKDIGTKARSPLICPRCKNLMDFERAGDVETDVCLACHGVWLDAGEMRALREASKKGFAPDGSAKAIERIEDREFQSKNSNLNKFLRRLVG